MNQTTSGRRLVPAPEDRMGAALTYARRYIAGEDDLDAPDLNCQPVAEAGVRASAAPPPHLACQSAARTNRPLIKVYEKVERCVGFATIEILEQRQQLDPGKALPRPFMVKNYNLNIFTDAV